MDKKDLKFRIPQFMGTDLETPIFTSYSVFSDNMKYNISLSYISERRCDGEDC